MIAWKYIDKTAATIAAIRDYQNMCFIINNTPDKIKEVNGSMTTPHMPTLTGLPSSQNPQAGEDKLSAQIDILGVLQSRYDSAVEYMAWFEPAWQFLTDNERHILSEFYMTDNLKSGATYRIMKDLGFSESNVERKRAKAFRRLCVLLFG